MAEHEKLLAALGDLFEAFGFSNGHLCGVTEQFGEASAAEIIAFAARLKRRSGAAMGERTEPSTEHRETRPDGTVLTATYTGKP